MGASASEVPQHPTARLSAFPIGCRGPREVVSKTGRASVIYPLSVQALSCKFDGQGIGVKVRCLSPPTAGWGGCTVHVRWFLRGAVAEAGADSL